MNERDPMPPTANTGLFVDEPHSFGPQVVEGRLDVSHRIRHVMHALAPRRQELADGRVGGEGGEQLNVGTADGDHGLFDSLARHHFPMNGLDVVLAPVLVQGDVEVVNGNPDVMNVDQKH